MLWARDPHTRQLSAVSGHLRREVDADGVAWGVLVGLTTVVEGRGRGTPGLECERISGLMALEHGAEALADMQKALVKELGRTERRERRPK